MWRRPLQRSEKWNIISEGEEEDRWVYNGIHEQICEMIPPWWPAIILNGANGRDLCMPVSGSSLATFQSRMLSCDALRNKMDILSSCPHACNITRNKEQTIRYAVDQGMQRRIRRSHYSLDCEESSRAGADPSQILGRIYVHPIRLSSHFAAPHISENHPQTNRPVKDTRGRNYD
jgi:hypothetical protein